MNGNMSVFKKDKSRSHCIPSAFIGAIEAILLAEGFGSGLLRESDAFGMLVPAD